MKRITISIFFIALVFSAMAFIFKPETNTAAAIEGEAIEWMSLQEALDQNYNAKPKDKKKIFIDVYTDWCGWCKVMDKKTFTDAEVIELMNENYLPVKLDAESNKEITYKGQKGTYRDFARSLRINGYPTTVYMDENLEVKAVRPGYVPANQMVEILANFAEKGSLN